MYQSAGEVKFEWDLKRNKYLRGAVCSGRKKVFSIHSGS